MIEIKFRGKRVDNGEWVYGSLIIYNDVDYRIYNRYLGENEVDPNTIGQYTGLKDKNGKEIYDGDVVHLYYYRQNDLGETLWFHRNVVVKWSDDDTFYGIGGWDGDDYFGIATRYRHSIVEVIGNIHDKEK